MGEHLGLANYTIGQRKGLDVGSSTPLYVIRKDMQTNQVVVGGKHELGTRRLVASEVNWIEGAAPQAAFRAEVKTRYTAMEQPARVSINADGDSAQVVFDEPQRDITPGQAAVFLDGDLVLGGGIIQMPAQEL